MNYTISNNQNALERSFDDEAPHCAECFINTSAVGTLTNYKEVVDIDESYSFYDELKKYKYYGLSKLYLFQTMEKLRKQKAFLNTNYLHDRINGTNIPLADLVISAYHSPERYYAEIQNRVNTLERIAKQRDLKPLFMTLTLPSEYHQYKTTKNNKLIKNKKYNGTTPNNAVKILTKMFSRLRQDRSLKELSKENRIYFRVNEPHQDGTPHTHILMFVPGDRIQRVKKAYERLYDNRANDIQIITDDINNSVAYVMKYINKVLPLSKKKELSEKELYLNAWYSKNRIIRFNSSKTLAPLSLYRLLHKQYSMFALTKLVNEKSLTVYVTIDTNKILEIFDGDEMIYSRNDSYDIKSIVNNLQNYSQTNDSAIGSAA